MHRGTLLLLTASLLAAFGRSASPGCVNPLGKPSAYRLGEGPTAHAKRLKNNKWEDVNSVDYLAKAGTPVYAPANGTVCKTCTVGRTKDEIRRDRFGLNSFTLLGDDGQTWYLTHLESVSVKAGQRLTAGQPVATVGAYRGKNAHLHLAVRRGFACTVLTACTPPDKRPCK